MARPNVTVIIDDQSFVIPGTESGGLHRAGFISDNALIPNLGTTAERNSGIMTIGSMGDWYGRLSSLDPIQSGLSAGNGGNHSSINSGGTGARWPGGPTGAWEGEWWTVHNYLQYGGVAVVGSTGEEESTVGALDALSNKQVALDSVVAMSSARTGLTLGGVLVGAKYYSVVGDIANVNTVVNARLDCIGVYPHKEGETLNDSWTDAAASTSITPNEYAIAVYGAKRFLGTSNDADNDVKELNCAPDVAGCLARTDRESEYWFSPAGFKRGDILDSMRLVYNPTDAEQDEMYAQKINPVVTFPGEGTVLFGDKTLAAATSTLSRINVSRLFIYLKKIVGSAARSLLFEMNDEDTRNAFVNSIEPLLERIKGRRGVYDYKVVCDESNNPGSIVDVNQFVADVFIKPTKSINFIRITFTNVNTSVDLG
jgi:hypothetical protein